MPVVRDVEWKAHRSVRASAAAASALRSGGEAGRAGGGEREHGPLLGAFERVRGEEGEVVARGDEAGVDAAQQGLPGEEGIAPEGLEARLVERGAGGGERAGAGGVRRGQRGCPESRQHGGEIGHGGARGVRAAVLGRDVQRRSPV
jgi:hypothetical protein